MRNIVMSDTGGWLPQLLSTFDKLGIDAEAGTIPKDMRVIHCGDLIHKGKFSSQCLAVVTKLMLNNPGQWIQLAGNHEAQHLPGAPQFWHCDCSPNDVQLLRVLQQEEMLQPTFALEKASLVLPHHGKFDQHTGPVLFSHGGLTEGFWRRWAGREKDALKASALLNELPMDVVSAPGLMLGENVPAAKVGPVWALANTEVFNSWTMGTPMPFTQLHGHTTSYSYDGEKWWPGLEKFQQKTTLLPESRAVLTELNNNLMLGVDPGFSQRQPRVSYQPWVEFTTDF